MYPYEGPPTANIMIVGDAVKGVDERQGHFFRGNDGEVLDKLLREAGLSRGDCILTAISNIKAPGDKLEFFFEDKAMKVPRPYWKGCLVELRTRIEELQPNIIIALGPVAQYYLTGNYGINSFRGYIVPCTLAPDFKVMSTIHPSVVDKDWKLYFTAAMDLRKAVKNSTVKELPHDKRILRVNQPLSAILDYCEFLLHDHKGHIGLDVETVSPGSHVNILGIADSPLSALSVTFMDDKNEPRYDPVIEAKIWSKLAQVIETKELVMQNGKYDKGVLWKNNGILCRNYNKDIMIAAHAAWPECPRSLGYLASVCLNAQPWKHTSQETPELYNAADAANTLGIWDVMELELSKSGTRHVHDFEMEQNDVAIMMELQGININRKKQAHLIKKHGRYGNVLKRAIDKAIGRPINLGSPKQLADLLYGDMALPKQYKRDKKSGENRLTTGADALAVLSRLSSNPVLQNIAKYKKTIKLMTFLDCTVSPNNTVHTCYNTTGANMAHEHKGVVTDEDDSFKSFGRWSSSASIIMPYGTGNLQNIPPTAREMYDAGEGRVFLQADYKQAEAVVVAYLIGDKKLINLFKASFGLSEAECKRKNLDVHKITAASMNGFKVDFVMRDGELFVEFSEEVTANMRKVGKTIRHAKNYSAGPGVLARKLGISLVSAKQIMMQYDQANPELPIWQREIVKQLARTRVLTNLFGRHHKFLDRWGDDLFRSSYSFIPQSTVGDLLNKALVILYREFAHELEIRIQLHDAIYVVVNDDEASINRGKEILKHCMVVRVQPLVCDGQEFFIDIDYATGRYWGELH